MRLETISGTESAVWCPKDLLGCRSERVIRAPIINIGARIINNTGQMCPSA